MTSQRLSFQAAAPWSWPALVGLSAVAVLLLELVSNCSLFQDFPHFPCHPWHLCLCLNSGRSKSLGVTTSSSSAWWQLACRQSDADRRRNISPDNKSVRNNTQRVALPSVVKCASEVVSKRSIVLVDGSNDGERKGGRVSLSGNKARNLSSTFAPSYIKVKSWQWLCQVFVSEVISEIVLDFVKEPSTC